MFMNFREGKIASNTLGKFSGVPKLTREKKKREQIASWKKKSPKKKESDMKRRKWRDSKYNVQQKAKN